MSTRFHYVTTPTPQRFRCWECSALFPAVAFGENYGDRRFAATFALFERTTSQCASLCEFFFRDGVHTATIFPQGFKFPKLNRGKPVTIYAQIISGEGQVVFSLYPAFRAANIVPMEVLRNE